MIPNNQADIDKMRELAERNIANGDWGDEVSMPGLPEGGGILPITPQEREAKRTVSSILAKAAGRLVPKRKE